MNPQVHYTPQQQMGYGGYSVPCRTGNWAEDEYMGVLNTQAHLSKEKDGMLASQQLSGTLTTALSPATLAPAPSDGAVRFGDTIMLSAALGGVLAYDTSNRSEVAQEAYIVSRTRELGAVACTRTAWTVTPLDSAPEDGILRIGMPFALSVKAADGATLYLQSQRYTLHNLNYGGTSAKSGAGVLVVPAMSADTVWKVNVLDPTELAQFESAGQPVPANTFVSLQHANTCALLSTEGDDSCGFRSGSGFYNKFGSEFTVSAITNTSITKGVFGKRIGQPVGPGNHFAFTTAEA